MRRNQPCDDCRQDAHHRDLTIAEEIDLQTLALDFQGEVCHRCARNRLDAYPPRRDNPTAAEALRSLLSARFGEAMRLIRFHADGHRAAVLCRRLRPRPKLRAPRRLLNRETTACPPATCS
jgi:hypothetical protein